MTSRVSLEVTEVVGKEWTEALATLSNEAGDQEMYMTPAEMSALYARLKLYYEQGTWGTSTVTG